MAGVGASCSRPLRSAGCCVAPAGSSSTSASMTPRVSPSPRSCRTKKRKRPRLSRCGVGLLCKPWRHCQPRHDRQRFLLEVEGLRKGLPRPRPQHIRTKPYTPKTNGPFDKLGMMGRTPHPDRAQGMGLRLSLSNLDAPGCRTARLDASLASPTRRPKIQNTHQSPRIVRGQPVEAPQLALTNADFSVA